MPSACPSPRSRRSCPASGCRRGRCSQPRPPRPGRADRRARASDRAGLCRRPAARRAIARGPACLACLAPGRAPGWPPHPGAAAVTAAGVRTPPPNPPRPARRARLPSPGLRLTLAVPGKPPDPGRARPAGGSGRAAVGRAVLALVDSRRRGGPGSGAAGGRDRGGRDYRGHHPRPVRRSGTGHRPLAPLPAAGRGTAAHRGRLRLCWPPGHSAGACRAAPWRCCGTWPG